MFPEERSLVQEMQGRPFVLLGVNAGDDLKVAQNSVKKNKLNWRSFFDGDSGRITGLFQIRAFPTVMLIDHQGVIAYPNLRGKKLIPEIKRLVKAAEADGMQGEKIAPQMRTFRDRTGKHRIEAIAQAMSDDQVRLLKQAGGTVTLSLVDLSRSDQDYLRTLDLPELEQTGTSESNAAGEDFRKFLDATGKHSVEAVFVGLQDGQVTLRKRDGSTTTLDLERLSPADQEFIREQTGQ